jgi:hypothetical protein
MRNKRIAIYDDAGRLPLSDRTAITNRQWNSDTQRWDYPLDPEILPAMEALMKLDPSRRVEVFREFCHSCGSDDPGCQCWNDE